MLAKKEDIIRTKGDNYPIRIKISKSKTEAMDITGATITMKVLIGTIVSFTAAIIDGANGIAEFSFLTSSFTTPGVYDYEIEMNTSGGIFYTIMNGTVTIVADLG